jgi:hypothetical protein
MATFQPDASAGRPWLDLALSFVSLSSTSSALDPYTGMRL